jgi:hypothetical protein
MQASVEAYIAVEVIVHLLDLLAMFGDQSRPVGLRLIEPGKLTLEGVDYTEKTLKGLKVEG